MINPLLRSVIEINPDAQNQAGKADEERRKNNDQGGSRYLGELHGIPVLIKDIIATKDKMNTTAGSYALLGAVAPRDAGVVEKLRKARASLSEWYNFAL
ncbi:amidase, putative [Ricinus communis]|uniref:Amidase, putative n=1 Tax=Ricinus communis TaxID=3988 RepID=B9SQK0_RICCO|nr:amidase, putative [Ricinus communis]